MSDYFDQWDKARLALWAMPLWELLTTLSRVLTDEQFEALLAEPFGTLTATEPMRDWMASRLSDEQLDALTEAAGLAGLEPAEALHLQTAVDGEA
ncbi:MAG: hypothetical protein Q4G46_00160 [Propionibacteriaceae bacterium]|nr:hypothetical protein [Propionibacteriaceae bacterium]